MTVNLRDRLYGDTGLPVQGATVQAYTITGGGTDAGTVSTLTASTTTDVNGVWKFTALADPGAGNWYDVKIINGQQVRWRYGNIEAVIASLLLQSTVWASPHFTAPVVDSGGLTVTSGNIGIGGAPTPNAGIWEPNALTVNAAVSAYGMFLQPTLVATANNDTLYGLNISPTFNDNAKTGVKHVPLWTGSDGLMWKLGTFSGPGYAGTTIANDGATHTVSTFTTTTNGGSIYLYGVTAPVSGFGGSAGIQWGFNVDGAADNPLTHQLATTGVGFPVCLGPLGSSGAGSHTFNLRAGTSNSGGVTTLDGGINASIFVFEGR